MSNKHSSDRSPHAANATLDALLQKGIQADQRATKPTIITPHAEQLRPASVVTKAVSPPLLPSLERLTVRFTQSEARLLEKARGVARSMGYKISDTAVFRLALNALVAEQLTPQAIESILVADGRRRSN